MKSIHSQQGHEARSAIPAEETVGKADDRFFTMEGEAPAEPRLAPIHDARWLTTRFSLQFGPSLANESTISQAGIQPPTRHSESFIGPDPAGRDSTRLKRLDSRLRGDDGGRHRVTCVIASVFAVFFTAPLCAQNFNSGSTGADGAFTMSQNTTLDVPPNGIFNFTTVTITGGSLTFRRNALNTPVFVLATGDISVTNANIFVDGVAGTANPPAGGAGGPGGFDGGDPGVQSIAPGAGHGPGGGEGGDAGVAGTAATSAGAAAYATSPAQPSTSDGAVYGSALLVPIVGGSGGGGAAGSGNTPGQGGSGGGGAILLASNTSIAVNSASIFARGGDNGFPHTGQGSGGAIRLVAPVVGGNGTLSVRGGSGGVNANNGDIGGQGRVRIDTIDRTQIRFNYDPGIAVLSVGSFMAVFPPVVPKLQLIEVAGQAIAGGAPVDVLLPFGSNPNQTVKVRATDFAGTVPIDVVLVPTSGASTTVPAQINMTSNPAQVTVNVTFPVNNRTRVWAWTR